MTGHPTRTTTLTPEGGRYSPTGLLERSVRLRDLLDLPL